MNAEIKKDAWGRPIWVPSDYPFVVRVYRQSSQSGCHGWAVDTIGSYATYEEAKTVANVPLGPGVMERYVVQAMNAATWQKNGRWRTCFQRKRGKVIIETGPTI